MMCFSVVFFMFLLLGFLCFLELWVYRDRIFLPLFLQFWGPSFIMLYALPLLFSSSRTLITCILGHLKLSHRSLMLVEFLVFFLLVFFAPLSSILDGTYRRLQVH